MDMELVRRMKILWISIFFHHIRFTDSKKIMFHSYFEIKNDKVLTINIVRFSN